MTPDQEAEFLEQFREQAGAGSVLVAGRLHQALEEFLGKRVSTATVYRILERNGWRKIVPRPAHPKKDPKDAEAFKKGATKPRSEEPRSSPKPKGSS
jgi:transposase